MSNEGKKIELNLHDTVTTKEKIGNAPTKEDIERMQKAVVLCLLDGKKVMRQLWEVLDKLGLKHSANALDAAIVSIGLDLDEYEKQKEAENAK